jgi:hypothetical protein
LAAFLFASFSFLAKRKRGESGSPAFFFFLQKKKKKQKEE